MYSSVLNLIPNSNTISPSRFSGFRCWCWFYTASLSFLTFRRFLNRRYNECVLIKTQWYVDLLFFFAFLLDTILNCVDGAHFSAESSLCTARHGSFFIKKNVGQKANSLTISKANDTKKSQLIDYKLYVNLYKNKVPSIAILRQSLLVLTANSVFLLCCFVHHSHCPFRKKVLVCLRSALSSIVSLSQNTIKIFIFLKNIFIEIRKNRESSSMLIKGERRKNEQRNYT